MLITIETHGIFLNLIKFCIHIYVNIRLITGMRNSLFLKDVALLSIRPAGRGQLVKMIITLEPHTILDQIAFLFI